MDGVYRARREIYMKFCWRNLKEGNQLEDRGVDGRVLLQVR